MLSPHLFISESLGASPQPSAAPKRADRHPDALRDTSGVFSETLEKVTERRQTASTTKHTASHQQTDSSHTAAERVEHPHKAASPREAVSTVAAKSDPEQSEASEQVDGHKGALEGATPIHHHQPESNHHVLGGNDDASASDQPEGGADQPSQGSPSQSELASGQLQDGEIDTDTLVTESQSKKTNQEVMSDGEELLQQLSVYNRQLATPSVVDNVMDDKASADGNSLPQFEPKTKEKAEGSASETGLNDAQLAQLFGPSSQSVTPAELASEQEQAPPVTGQMAAGESIDLSIIGNHNGAVDSSLFIDGKGIADGAGMKSATIAPAGSMASQPTAFQHTPLSVFGTDVPLQNPTSPQSMGLASDAMASMMSAADVPEGTPIIPAALTTDLAASTLLADDTQPSDSTSVDSATISSAAVTSSPLHSLQAKINEAAQANNQPPLQLNHEKAGDALADRMQMMMSKNLKHVDIRLDPPELGRLQIKLTVNNDQASVQFTVGNQQTRDLVEQAMPRLRELLHQQGLQLAQSSVHQDSSRQFAGQSQQQGGQGGDQSASRQGAASDQTSESADFHGVQPMDIWLNPAKNGVDYYA
ncbi:flagellar hook-length control protein FliK [Photobacterium nomapromontoriensis]|uniref:flagellar hook-length control protein FliK n=1 Tax=Photobacterium nomapromontoriensis TaxID=2910237 RepID=UPI003D0A9797